jgi:hypothetical protein
MSIFLDRSRYFFFEVVPQLYSRGWVDPVPDPLLRKSGSAGNRTQTSGYVARNSVWSEHTSTYVTLDVTICVSCQRKQASSCCLLHVVSGFAYSLTLKLARCCLWNVGSHSLDCRTLYSRRQKFWQFFFLPIIELALKERSRRMEDSV